MLSYAVHQKDIHKKLISQSLQSCRFNFSWQECEQCSIFGVKMPYPFQSKQKYAYNNFQAALFVAIIKITEHYLHIHQPWNNETNYAIPILRTVTQALPTFRSKL